MPLLITTVSANGEKKGRVLKGETVRRRGKSSDSGRAGLIEFYGNAAYISTFSFAVAKEIRKAVEKLF